MDVVFSKSLLFKQAILTLALAIVLSVISSVIQLVNAIQYQKTQINQNFEELLAIVDKPLSEAMFRLDIDYAQQQIDSLLLNASIAHVEVRDDAGVLFVEATAATSNHFAVSHSLVNYFLSDLPDYQRRLRLETPVFDAGTVTLLPEKRFLLNKIFKEHLSILTYNLFKDVLLASLICLLFYLLVTRPLRRLTESLSTVDVNGNFPLPSSFYRHHHSDELGDLHTTFSLLWKKLNTALSDLERSDNHTKAMIEHAADGMLLLDQNDRVILVNSAAEIMLKIEGVGLQSNVLDALYTESSWAQFTDALNGLKLDEPLTVEATYKAKDIELSVEIRMVKYQIQSNIETLLLIRDVSERKQTQAHIHHLAYYDSVTTLPNRQYFVDQVGNALRNQKTKTSGCYSAVIFMDLDRFKTINDSLGHDVGDQLLACVATQLSLLMDDNVIIARMGGDEFAFLFINIAENAVQAEKLSTQFANQLMTACQQVKKVARHEVHITASLGGTIFDGKERSVEAILKQADTALYRAKESGRNTFALYMDDMQAVSDARLEMEKALHHATENTLFQLYYQPQTNANNELIGAEALIRWNDPKRGFISPAEFIPVAEEIGLIVEIGHWVLNEALSQVATWLREGKWRRSWRMSINVSPIQFQQASFLPMLTAQLAKHKVPASCIDLEITENMLLNDLATSLEKMNDIKGMGIHLSIDDFGTGYSSLKYLKSLPIDRLKIDQSFVRDLLTDKSDEAIVHAVIAMAKALNISVIAEGVETFLHYERLREIGCYYYQGYYFGHPLPSDDFTVAFVDSVLSPKLS
ncbi:putative bifunctional diguanylate cyclase/phosphodiesterase [Marinomonas sp. IMCC 4694]|uniref:putative bifunctional diguanylate cyclase/phosphodiesterase n=1 Tax=Marinomonas sp. IMCC 4694 TaxID=2605432 RepID=UPI0011E7E615|nr:EAL domain-containing protein [Marinomonas sp. IMCC 4694]TYL47359.1 EAL domain-containing protein [Marinomonas sp. IMCC 4694]